MRWRYGDTNPVISGAVPTATVIEVGDLIYQTAAGIPYPASSQADQSTEAANQELFANKFLGVSMQRSKSGETAPIRVATSGVFEFDCPSGTWIVGDLAAVDEASNGTELLDQTVTNLGIYSGGIVMAKRAIGRCAKAVYPAATSVLIDIVSTVMYGGVEGQSTSG
jgi:hypothetical protein